MKALAHWFVLVGSILLLQAPARAQGQAGGVFAIHFDEQQFPAGFRGDLILAFADPQRGEPRSEMQRWFGAPPVMRFHVQVAAGASDLMLSHTDARATYPSDWWDVEPKDWRVQAIARVSRTGRRAGHDEGDVFSAAVDLAYDPESPDVVRLTLDQVAAQADFRETDRVRLFEFESDALSKFHRFPYIMRAGVLLPENYNPDERYPVVYSITGFGGTLDAIHRWAGRTPEGSPLANAIIVVPDASNRYGHSVFCDSPSIGPWGTALVDEFVPAFDEAFGGAGAQHRYVTGVSSGGWSSLWLQVTYPDAFAGCWSHVPDPIDFHDFQGIDLYTPLPDGSARNMYLDADGGERAVARTETDTPATYRDFVEHEHVLNPGGQIRSFEATFSKPSVDGSPRRVFDVKTGAIDHEVAESWRAYDISHKLLTEWDELRDQLAGKIHVYAGELDTFYLEGAVKLFQAAADEAGMLDEMVIEVVPGMPHQLHGPGHAAMVETLVRAWEARELVTVPSGG
ncbi:MAG: S-formylglutathione hydrolase FrmB [Chlamydiales bacterium]|jgi:S-formylglutathione hydrolase FrmB